MDSAKVQGTRTKCKQLDAEGALMSHGISNLLASAAAFAAEDERSRNLLHAGAIRLASLCLSIIHHVQESEYAA